MGINKADRQPGGQTGWQTGRQTGGQTGMQTGRQIRQVSRVERCSCSVFMAATNIANINLPEWSPLQDSTLMVGS